MIKTRKYYSDRVILALQNGYQNIDFKIQEREVFPVIDDVVNKLAEKDYFDNWRMTGQGVDEHFVTEFEEIEVIDQDNDKPSYFVFPSNWAALPNNRGIDEIWPLKFKMKGNDHSVVVMTHSDFRRYKSLYAGKLEGRLGGYPKGINFEFTTCGVKKKYGNMGLRLVVRSSADISNTAPYPIPANREGEVIGAVVQYFITKREEPTDEVRDSNDQAA